MISPAVYWEDVPCPLCGARDEECLLTQDHPGRKEPLRLVRCRRCGMGYLNPRPDERTIAAYYPDEYHPYTNRQPRPAGFWSRVRGRLESLVLAAFRGYPGPGRSAWWRPLAWLARPWFSPGRDSHTSIPYQGEGRLLDFGCGGGWFAHRMQRRGWQVVGMDFSEGAARRVREAYGIPVLVGSLPHPEVEPGSFDVVNMGAVLEHVHYPHRVIDAAARALRPGGTLALSVPNLDSWAMRTFGRHWFSLDLPHHLLHFTPATLRHLLELHGLKVEELRMHGRSAWLRRTLEAARDSGEECGPVWLRSLGKLRIVRSWVTRWTVWNAEADCLFAIARKPAVAQPSARAA